MAVVVEVLPPEKDVGIYGQTMDGEAVSVAFPSSLDSGAGDWRDIHPALLSSYCDDQGIKLYTYKHTNLEFAANPFAPGDRVFKVAHDDPDEALVVTCEGPTTEDDVSVIYTSQLNGQEVFAAKLADHCEDEGMKLYSYSPDDLEWAN